MTIALEAAFGAGPGVIAIAGTGSIAYGRDAERPHRARRRLGVRRLRRRLRPLDRPPRHLRHPERSRSRPRNRAQRHGPPSLETQHHRRTCASKPTRLRHPISRDCFRSSSAPPTRATPSPAICWPTPGPSWLSSRPSSSAVSRRTLQRPCFWGQCSRQPRSL